MNKQIAKLLACIAPVLPDMDSATIQEWIDDPNGLQEAMKVLNPSPQKLLGDHLSRQVSVNRTRTPKQALNFTGRKQYTNAEVVATMPRGKGKKVEVIFFKLGRFVTDEELEREYASRGFTACDPYSLAAVNEANPAFADEHPNSTHWKDANDKWCFTAFNRWDDKRCLGVYRDDDGWDDGWWFAGL